MLIWNIVTLRIRIFFIIYVATQMKDTLFHKLLDITLQLVYAFLCLNSKYLIPNKF